MKKKAAPRTRQPIPVPHTSDKVLDADAITGQKRKSTEVDEEGIVPGARKRKRRRKHASNDEALDKE